jgi:acetolactate synthase I/II/III large subunit
VQRDHARDGQAGPQAPGRPGNAGRDLTAQTAAEAFLAALARRGVEYLYVNAGTDFASIVEAYARRGESRLDLPTPVICPHENLAVGMAHGYALATGRPQAVMVHVSVGTANCICGVFNAARDQVPLLLAAGRTPLYESGRLGARSANIHWAQEMFDQAAMLRELVKWDYELHDALQADLAVDRALAIAQTAPRGPVYLTLPREVLAQELSGVEAFETRTAVPAPAAPDSAAVERLADLLAAAKLPVFITSAAGGTREEVDSFARLVGRFGIGVVEYRARRVCLPASHPQHLGTDNRVALEQADLIVVLECDVPWMPSGNGEPKRDARIVHVGVDPLFVRYPVRSFRSDLTLSAALGNLLPPLEAALERRRASGTFDPAARARRIGEIGTARREELSARRERIAAEPRMSRAWLNHCLNEALPEDAILVNEYWVDRDLVDREHAGTYFGTPPAGGLGWGLPAALGACQADPDRVVVAAVGDGAYLFANPAACHQAAAAHRLPVLTIVCNNAQWAAVQWAALGVYPSGHASRTGTPVPLSSLAPAADFERYAEASGGYGERVTEAADLPPALDRALRVVRKERRQALLNVVCA